MRTTIRSRVSSTLRYAASGVATLFTAAVANAAPGAALPADSTLAKVQRTGSVKVCIWPDYYGITWRNPRTQQLQGLDIEMAQALGRDLGVKVEFVESSFVGLIDDVLSSRCDVAMFGVGNLPHRAEKLRFTAPYLMSGIYGITTRSNRLLRDWNDIDQPGVKVAVQAGTFMEKVMTDSLKKATMVVVRPPTTREQELEAGRVDVFMTDYPYSRRLLDNADWARLISPPTPFHPLGYAYPVRPGDDAWFERMGSFVAAIKRDGRLAEAARRYGLSEVVVAR